MRKLILLARKKTGWKDSLKESKKAYKQSKSNYRAAKKAYKSAKEDVWFAKRSVGNAKANAKGDRSSAEWAKNKSEKAKTPEKVAEYKKIQQDFERSALKYERQLTKAASWKHALDQKLDKAVKDLDLAKAKIRTEKAILKSVKKTHVKPQIVDDLYSSKMTKDKKKQTKSLYNKGYDTKEIAEKLNIPLEDVGGYLVEIGILD